MANKAIHVLAAAALLLVSCSNDDTVQVASGTDIHFRTVVGMSTRALPADLAGLKAAGFSVSAFATTDNEEKYGFRDLLFTCPLMFGEICFLEICDIFLYLNHCLNIA